MVRLLRPDAPDFHRIYEYSLHPARPSAGIVRGVTTTIVRHEYSGLHSIFIAGVTSQRSKISPSR